MGGSSRCRSQFQHFWGYAIASRRPTQFEFLDGCRLNFAKGWCICWDGGIIRQQLTACHQVPHTQELLGDSVLQNNVHTTVVGLLVEMSKLDHPSAWLEHFSANQCLLAVIWQPSMRVSGHSGACLFQPHQPTCWNMPHGMPWLWPEKYPADPKFCIFVFAMVSADRVSQQSDRIPQGQIAMCLSV